MPQHTRISFTLPSLQGAYRSPVLPFHTPPFLGLDPNADRRNQALLKKVLDDTTLRVWELDRVRGEKG